MESIIYNDNEILINDNDNINKKNTNNNSIIMNINYKIEKEYYLSLILTKIYDTIYQSQIKKKSYIFQEIWETFLLSNVKDDFTDMNQSLFNEHLEDTQFLKECNVMNINLSLDLWKSLIELLYNWNIKFDKNYKEDDNQTLVNTINTFIYKKYKKVIGMNIYNELLKKTDRKNILLMLMRYDNIFARKHHMIVQWDKIIKITKINKPIIDLFSSPLCFIESNDIFRNISNSKDNKYCSLFTNIDGKFDSLGNMNTMPFSVFTDKILLIHPPHIESYVIKCIDFIYNVLSYVNYINIENTIKSNINIILIFPKKYKNNTSTCYKQIMNHKNLVKYKVQLESQQTEQYLLGIPERTFKTTNEYIYYDYNGIQKTTTDDVVMILEFII